MGAQTFAGPRTAEITAGLGTRLARWAGTWLGVVLVLALLELVVRTGLISERSLPLMTATFGTLLEQLGHASYWEAILHTLQGWAIGLVIATAIGVPIGLAVGFSELVHRGLRPIIEFLRPVPSVALIPLAILVYGTGLEAKVFLVVYAATWPILVQTMYGARDIDPVQRETARAFRIPWWQRTSQVLMPSALPYIATGLRIASATALILAVTAELIIGSAGLGRSITIARAGGAVELMYALIITTGLLGWALNSAFAAVERRLLHWHPSHREVVA
jgi:ABC-type nitrate/sulfonate/bicarbonate transport system permease component